MPPNRSQYAIDYEWQFLTETKVQLGGFQCASIHHVNRPGFSRHVVSRRVSRLAYKLTPCSLARCIGRRVRTPFRKAYANALMRSFHRPEDGKRISRHPAQRAVWRLAEASLLRDSMGLMRQYPADRLLSEAC